MPVDFECSSVMTVSISASGEASVSSGQHPVATALQQPPKKKRNLPGMPDPDAEVIALSPKTLLATNRFVCEICNKGFQRDQNLQLHRRGHNLPWKLRQRTGKEVKKRVYVCPELNCVHHDPSRALGDLTGIKKHFSRKHGEKKWKCDKCSKKYAVQSDWKAHSKTCGTREYRCDCGTLFSRRDSFITHRAFCDALAEESAKSQIDPVPNPHVEKESKAAVSAVLQVPHMEPTIPPPPPDQQGPKNTAGVLHYMPHQPPVSISVNSNKSSGTSISGGSSNSATTSTTSVFASLFASSSVAPAATTQRTSLSDLICAMSRTERCTGGVMEPPSLCLSSHGSASLFPPAHERRHFATTTPTPPAHMSATALLQKAAQMGAAASCSSFFRSLGLVRPLSPAVAGGNISEGGGDIHCRRSPAELKETSLPYAGLGLGVPQENRAGLSDLMMGSSSLFGSKPATMDFLGLGMHHNSSVGAGGLSAIMEGGIDVISGTPASRPMEITLGEGVGWRQSKTKLPATGGLVEESESMRNFK
ncbi:hypothetical protein HPP92_023654 [Vanilla planifolia]|uniref:Protein EARLY HEADING DATE 2 n=1 Tax=Vanilla planifolia TaxID=51239 RepID=A0A835UEC8_VANPL|nr:hypothetical protein HPP92_023654 [Vanilla planifolia]